MKTEDVPDALLVFPPFWDAGMPYLSVPTLAAYLRTRGLRAETADLNLSIVRNTLTQESVEDALCKAMRTLERWSTRNGSLQEREDFKRNLKLCEMVWKAGGGSLLEPFSPEASIPSTVEDYTAFRRKLGWVFHIVSAPFHPMLLTASGLLTTASLYRMSGLSEYVERGEQIPYGDHTMAFAQSHGRRGIPILGISVAGPSQMLSALFLARCFKGISPGTFVCIGGPQIPYILHSLQHCEKPFDWVDAFVSGEGELPLTELCLTVKAGKDIANVRGLHILRGGEVHHTGDPEELNIEELPVPDFTNFEPGSYLVNNGTVPLTFARGCSWSRCAFCTQFVCFSSYRAMSGEKIAAHISEVTSRIPVKTIALNDENVTPKRLQEFAAIIRGNGQRVHWQALARLSARLSDSGLCRELADSGCRMLCLGLENANQSVLDLNRKGIKISQVPGIMRALHDSGIWVHVFLLFGLPGDTRETAMNTVRFVYENSELFDSISPSIFRVERYSEIAKHPEQFGVTMTPTAVDCFDAEMPFEMEEWIQREEALIFLEFLIQTLAGTPQCPIEQGELNGQFILDLLSNLGVSGLRAEMERRAKETALAKEVLECDDRHYQKWWESPYGQQLEASVDGNHHLMSVQSRGLFVSMNKKGRTILRLRSLGLPFETIMKKYGHLFGRKEKHLEAAWEFHSFKMSLLSSRLIQETHDPD